MIVNSDYIHVISSSPVSSLCWLPRTSTSSEKASDTAGDNQIHYLACGSVDGTILLLGVEATATSSSCTVRRLTSLKLMSAVKAISVLTIHDEIILCAGCQDGSLRGWIVNQPSGVGVGLGVSNVGLHDLFVEKDVHMGGVNSIATRGLGIMVSGGEDGNVQVWRIGGQSHVDENSLRVSQFEYC